MKPSRALPPFDAQAVDLGEAVVLSRLAVNVMFVETDPGAEAQQWHRDQFPFMRIRGHGGSQSADIHTGVALYGPYGDGNPPAGIEYQAGIFSTPTAPSSQTYVPNASEDGHAVMHTGDVVHRGTASSQKRVAMYVGFTPVGINITHDA